MSFHNTKEQKKGGVCFKSTIKGLFLPLFKSTSMQWDILFQFKLGNNVKTLGQIAPLLSFFSPDGWHECCNKNNNARKGSLCHYKPNPLTLEKRSFHFQASQIKYLQGWNQ